MAAITAIPRYPVDAAKQVRGVLAEFGNHLVFDAKVMTRMFTDVIFRLRWRNQVAEHVSNIAVGSGAWIFGSGMVFVVFAMSFFTGGTVGLQGFKGLEQIGAEAFTGLVGSFANVREVTPLIAATALAAQVGAGFTAEIGAMRISDEIDALEVMSVPSLTYLVSTRVTATLVALTPIYLISLIASFFATKLVTTQFFGLSPGVYDYYFRLYLPRIDILYSVIKMIVFTIVVTLIHCYYGYNASGGPAGVGVAVGRAIRASIVAIVVINFGLSLLFWGDGSTVTLTGELMARTKLFDTDRWTVNHQALLGTLGLVLLGVMGTFGVKYAFGAYDPGYDLTARFEGAGQNLDTESVVKFRGVDVGRVESINLDDQDRAVVRLQIEPDVNVPESAVAVIRPISIFGPKFVDLIPGPGEAEGPYLEDGDEIAETRSSLELEDILGNASDLLEAVDPQDFTTVLHTFAEGIDGLDQEMADSITNGQTVLNAMVNSSDDRHVLFSSLASIADELADDGDTILAIGDNAHRGLPTLTEHEDEFAGLLEATSRLSGSLAGVIRANEDVLGAGIEGGAALSDVTAADLGGVVAYLDFVNTYGGVLDQVIRVPVAGEAFVAATQQFLMGSDPCQILVDVPECQAPAIDPGPDAAG